MDINGVKGRPRTRARAHDIVRREPHRVAVQSRPSSAADRHAAIKPRPPTAVKVIDRTQPDPELVTAIGNSSLRLATSPPATAPMDVVWIHMKRSLEARNWRVTAIRAAIFGVLSASIVLTNLDSLDKICLIHGVGSLAFAIDARITAGLGIIGLITTGIGNVLISQEANVSITITVFYLFVFSLLGIGTSIFLRQE